MTRTVLRWLSGLLFAALALSAQAQTSYLGFYSGTLSTGGQLAFYAESNSEVYVVVIDPASGSFGANTSIQITSTGHFAGTYSIATISGQINAAGAAVGTVSPLGITLAAQRAPISGATSALAGLYQGWVFDPNNRMLTMSVMVSANGLFYLYIQDGTTVTDAGYGTINSQGIFSWTDVSGNVSSGSIITTAGGVGWNGRYTKPGTGGFNFVVARRDSANRLVNISTLAQVAPGSPLTTGFVIHNGAKTVLIRGVGPALANFGVPTGFVPNPVLTVFSGSVAIASNSGWSSNSNAADISTESLAVGAFALPAGSPDSALLLSLEPGGYTAQVTGTAGTALIEVYEIQ